MTTALCQPTGGTFITFNCPTSGIQPVAGAFSGYVNLNLRSRLIMTGSHFMRSTSVTRAEFSRKARVSKHTTLYLLDATEDVLRHRRVSILPSA